MLKLITNTGLKLEEVKYYLQRMKDTESHANWHYFQFELDSFLTHAASVTNLPRPKGTGSEWYLEQELGKKPGFWVWYAKKAQELQGNNLMKFMRDERNIVVHYKNDTLHIKSDTKVNFINNNQVSASAEILPPPKPPETIIKRTWFFDTNVLTGNKEVIPVCEEYVVILEGILQDCHQMGF